MGFELEGANEVEAQLRKLADRLTKTLPAAMHKSLSSVEESAKERAPVRTGALRDSILTDTDSSGTTIIAEVGPTVDYADDAEFGTRNRAAQPYLRPAADELEDAVLDVLVDELNKVVDSL